MFKKISALNPRQEFRLAVIISALVGLWLAVATWDMAFWPTDTEVYYMEATRNLPKINFISQMHQGFDQEFFRFLHGKEFYILLAFWVQQVTGDTATLRPFLLICILGTTFSGILIFWLGRKLWGRVAGWIVYLLFTFCFWPYQQILYTGHLPLGLFLFLSASAVLFLCRGRALDNLWYFLSGVLLGLCFYSTTVAVLFFPYFVALYFLIVPRLAGFPVSRLSGYPAILISGVFVLSGFFAIFILCNYPDVIANFKKYLEFVAISSSHSHFFYNQPVLIQWISHPELPVRGGWIWVIKYFLLVMPVIFPLFVGTVGFLMWRVFCPKTENKWRWLILGMIFLGWSSPLVAEIRGVAQIGRSYFPSIIGVLTVIGFAVFVFERYVRPRLAKPARQKMAFALAAVILAHAAGNVYLFFGDVYPARMGVTFLARKIRQDKIAEIFTYLRHPQRKNTLDCLPFDLRQTIRFVQIESIMQPPRGVILVPPVTGDSIYLAAHTAFNDFAKDPFLTELFRKGNISDYAIASFPTLASSRIWQQEEEILAYKSLILKHGIYDPARTRVWLLDAGKIHPDIGKNVPAKTDLDLIQNGERNIGTLRPVLRFEGMMRNVPSPVAFAKMSFAIYRVGAPPDGLVAYIYRVSPQEKLWIPLSEGFRSEVVSARDIPSGPGETVSFYFSSGPRLVPGRYLIVIYRTGKPDDQNYYRIKL